MELADPKANKDEVCEAGEVKLKEAAESDFPSVEPFVAFFKKSNDAPVLAPASEPEVGVLPNPANPAKRLGPPS